MPWCCAGGTATPLLAETSPAPDTFGPMLLQPKKTALLVTNGSGEGPFIDRLRNTGWHVQLSPTTQAEPIYAQLRPHLVLLDNKLTDITHVSKSLHQISTATDDVFFVTISERPLPDKRRRSLAHAEVLHNVLWTSRDTSLVEWIARLSSRLRVVPALFAVLDEADQAVEVLDDARVVLYVNRAYENVTGCLRGEVIGQPESDVRRKSLPRPREDDRRRSSDWKCIRVPSSSYSNQYVYVKRRSLDGGMYRDVSLKSIRSQAMMEAPISEVISMLRDAAGRCEGESAQLVKDAVKVLSQQELYMPNIQKIRDGDRMATQYYDGLVRVGTLHHPPRHRKRSVVDAYKDKRGSHGERRRVSADVKNALENDNTFHFDILQLERVTEHHALSQLGMKIFERWKVAEVLGCNEDILLRWINTVEAHYHAGNAYHNATHAADVLQATSYFLDAPSVADHVSESHAIAALLAAAVHDLDHPGKGNAFLINTRQSLAILYNDQSILENHHVALAFQLTLQQNNNVNIFGALNRDDFSSMRQAIVEMVLATDIRRHFEYLAKFNQMNIVDVAEEQRDANSMIVCNMLVKCADISNPTRDWLLCEKWAYRIVDEYFEQTREEKEKGLPLTMEFFDRETCNVPITQCGFIDMFVREAFTIWGEFSHLPHLLKQLETNYETWKSKTSAWTPQHNINLL